MKTVYPAINRVFSLTLDGNHPRVQPLAMVKNYGGDPTGWQYSGKTVLGQKTRKFKLVSVSCFNDWDQMSAKLKTKGHIPERLWLEAWNQLIAKLKIMGHIPEGQWLEAFKDNYPKHDGNEPVAIADDHWADQEGDARFPQIFRDGEFDFGWVGIISDGCRWLIEVK